MKNTTHKNSKWGYKRPLLIAFIFAAASFVFAADKSLGITSADVDNYIKNFSSINKEIDAMGFNDKGMEREPTKDELKKRDEILKKYGIAGPSRFEKMERITQYSQQLDFCNSPKATKEQKDAIRNNMNPSDRKVIEPKYKEAMSAFNKYKATGNLFNFDIKDKINLPSIKKKKK